MNKLIPIIFLLPITLFAEETGNLLNQNFNTSDWSGTNKTSRHGNGTIAGVNDKYVESTISLSDTLTESQINNGWTSTLGADIWHWNNYNSTTTMKQTITDADGTVTTQIREVANTGCGYINCGDWATYTDSYTQGINSQSDYDIAVRFTFEESHNSSSHYATDLKNPILTIEHSLLSSTQAEEISTISETVNTTVEEIDFYEYIPEEFNFEMTEQPIIEMNIEEVYFEPQAIEELNAGVVNVFQEIIYDNQPTFEEVATEIQIDEGFIETTEVGQTINETFESSTTIEPNNTREEVVEAEPTEEVSRTANGNTSRENERGTNTKSVATVSGSEEEPVRETNNTPEQSETEDTVVAEEVEDEAISNEKEERTEVATSSEQESEGAGETSDSGSGDEGTEVADSGEESIESRSESVEEGRNEEDTRVSTQTISIENIEKRVNQAVKRVDQRLIATSLIVAKAMSNNKILDSYNNINQDIFNNQPIIDGGDYFETREYIDVRNIYAENQNNYNDPVATYQRNVQEAVDNRIRAEEHLRSIRGY